MKDIWPSEEYILTRYIAGEMMSRGLLTDKEYQEMLIKTDRKEGINTCSSPRLQRGSNTPK